MQPQPQSHTYYQIEYNIMKQFTNMYNSTHNKDLFECFVLDALLYSKNCHFIARFNDYLIWDYVDEFLKREYSRKESVERLPKFSEFYKNYLTFFCTPTFCDFYFNTVIQEHSENKAEIYYNEHFVHKANKKKENDNNKNVDAHLSGENSLYSSSNYNKYTTSKYKGKVGVLFDTINKRKIEHNTIMSMTNFLFGNENGKDNTLVFGSSSGNNKNGNSMVNSNNSSVKYSNQQTLANIINELIHKPKKINIHDNNNSNSNNKDKRITFNKHIKSSLKIKPKGMGVNVNANNNNNSSSNNTNQHIKHHQLHKNNSNIQQFNQNTPSVLTAITVSNSSTRKIPSQTVHKDNNEAQLTSHNNNNNNNHINIQQHQQHHSRNPPSHTQAFPSFNTLTKSQTQRDHFQSASNHNITSSSTNVFRQTLHKTNTIETILRQIAYKHLPTKSFNKQKQTQPHYIHIHNINNTNNNNNNTKSSKPRSTSKTKTPNLFSIDTFFIAKNIPHRNTHLNYNNNNNQHLPIRNIKSKDLFRYQLPPKSTSIKKYTNNINHNNNNINNNNNNNNDSNTMKFAFSLLVNNNNNNNHTNMHTHSNFSNHHHHRSNSHHKHSHSNSHNPNINNNNNVFKCGSGLTASNKNIHNININISNHINIMNSNNNNNRRSRNKNIYEIGTNGSNGNSAHNKIIFSSYPGYSLKGIKLTSNNNNNNNSGVVNNSSTQKGKVNMFQTANLFKSFSKLKIKAYTDKERIGCKNIKKGNGCPIKKIYNKQQSSNNNNNNNVNGNGVYCTLNHEGKKKCK